MLLVCCVACKTTQTENLECKQPVLKCFYLICSISRVELVLPQSRSGIFNTFCEISFVEGYLVSSLNDMIFLALFFLLIIMIKKKNEYCIYHLAVSFVLFQSLNVISKQRDNLKTKRYKVEGKRECTHG